MGAAHPTCGVGTEETDTDTDVGGIVGHGKLTLYIDSRQADAH